MSLLFEPINIGNMHIESRFVHSATYEVLALETGEVSDRLIKRYRSLARGEAGLIITGCMHVHPLGRSYKYRMGIHNDHMIPGLSRLVEAVHHEGGRIAFQLMHAGRQTTKAMIGQTPIGPSSRGRDPVNFVKPREMNANQIQEVIRSFATAAHRAVEAGVDGIQLHAADGYLINQFLSPFFNRRRDERGGSEHEGITPSLAVTYAMWLSDLGIDGLEISCGSSVYSFMDMCRGDVPVKELVSSLPFWKRPVGKLMMRSMAGKYGFEEGYNIQAAKMIKPVLGNVPLFVVGGLRKVSEMSKALEEKYADCISMSRPFIREPSIVRRIREEKAEAVACVSCNRCLAAIAHNIPVQCYIKRFPAS